MLLLYIVTFCIYLKIKSTIGVSLTSTLYEVMFKIVKKEIMLTGISAVHNSFILPTMPYYSMPVVTVPIQRKLKECKIEHKK